MEYTNSENRIHMLRSRSLVDRFLRNVATYLPHYLVHIPEDLDLALHGHVNRIYMDRKRKLHVVQTGDRNNTAMESDFCTLSSNRRC